MTRLRDALGQVVRSAVRGFRRSGPPEDLLPGQVGPSATTEAREVGPVTTSYNPSTDGDPDPGEIVWTWVPYVENDGRGKDRPVLIVAREPAGTLLAVQLSSQQHDGDDGWVPIGSGGWGRSRVRRSFTASMSFWGDDPADIRRPPTVAGAIQRRRR